MRTPSYRKHACGQAIVKIKGETHYLGTHGSAQSKEKYRDVLAKYWRPRNEYRGKWPTIEDLLARFVPHADTYYTESNELEHLKLAMRPLRRLYGEESTDDFGPKKLKRVRDAMVAEGLTRQGINKRIVRLRRIFAWGTSEELVPGEVLHQLQAVTPLAAGRTEAPESEEIKPVPRDHIDAVLDNAPEPVAAMVELQLLMACRPGEVVGMRRCDLETSGKVWVYRPPKHKNRWRGQKRQIYLGPRAIEILKAWLPPGLAL